MAKQWRGATIPDEQAGLRQSNLRGTVAFAFAEPGGRATQVFVSLRDNGELDPQGFAPFGRVIEGMDVADALESQYGENAGGGIRGGILEPGAVRPKASMAAPPRQWTSGPAHRRPR